MNRSTQYGFILVPALIFLMLLSLLAATSLNTAGYQSRLSQSLTKNQALGFIAKSGNRLLIIELPTLLNQHQEILTSTQIYWLPSYHWSEDSSLNVTSGIRLLETINGCAGLSVTGDLCYRLEIQSRVQSDAFAFTTSSIEEFLLPITNTGADNET